MKKRIMAMLLALAMMLGMCAQLVSAATPATYDVGYAKVDINPYADLKNATDFETFAPTNGAALLSLPIGGGNNVSKDTGLKDAEGNTIWTKTQMSTGGKTDDNGDGKIDKNDGLFATCIAVTDSQGNTVLMYSVDLLSAFDEILQEVRKIVLEEYGHYGLSAERILINGSHTHSGPGMTPDFEGVYNTKYDFTEDYKIYKEFLIFQMVKAARVALEDRASATMHKGTIDASDSKAAEGKIGDTLNSLRTTNKVTEIASDRYSENRVYNSVRHYKITAQEARKKLWGGGYYQDYYDRYQPASGGKVITYIAGNNFNGDWKTSGGFFTIDVTDNNGTVTKYVVTGCEPVSETDDKMHILEFKFADSSKKPIALVNFRGHLPSVGDSTVMSSSMVNSFRYVLEQKGYRTSYMQGAAGNVNSATRQPEGLWMFYPTQESVDNNITDTTHSSQRHNVYGTELAEVAWELLDSNSMKQVNTNGGEIRSTQYAYQSERKHISDAEYAAAKEYIRRVNLPATDANKIGITDSLLYTYETTGEKVAISSVFHANAINSSYSRNGSAGTVVDLYAVTIGDGFALVGASGELFDRYSKDGDLTENMWDNLVNDNTYGKPFVNGYAGNDGYFGSIATFDFSKDTIEAGNISFVSGSYETQTNSYVQGAGEALIEKMDLMLDFLGQNSSLATKEGTCQKCGKDVIWTALTQEVLKASNVMTSGHYYLTEDVSMTDMEAAQCANICIDLNGHTLNVYRGFEISQYAEVSVMDTSAAGTGHVTGYETTTLGGVFHVGTTGTLNLYSGTVNYAGEMSAVEHTSGGVLYIDGSFNMFGGKVEGTEVNWVGGAIYLNSNGVSNARIAGGTVTSGKAGARGACIANCGTITLSGNPTIAGIDTFGSSVPVTDALVFDGVFTGTVTINNATAGTDVGNAINNADIARARITIGSALTNNLQVQGTDVVAQTRTAFAYKNAGGAYTYTNDYTSAPGETFLILQKNITGNISLNKDTKFDLNGYTITGKVSVDEGKTLQVSDYTTADYDISDGVYGSIKITGSSGNIIGAEATEENDVYLKLQENGNYTFHAVDLNINSMSLKPDTQGLYYKHQFVGDEKVAELIADYGVALSLVGAPTKEDLIATADKEAEDNVVKGESVIYTRFSGNFGAKSSTSTLVTGIMKETNGYITNKRNSSKPIYGSAYARLTDGTVLMGVIRQRSLQQQVEGLDTKWEQMTQSQRNSLLRAFKPAGYARVLNGWTVPNMKNPTQTEEEQEILRILAIGNSHTVDATSMLAEVFAAEMPNQKVMIGNMYRSGCSVGQHVSYAKNNTVIYTYYKNENGSWSPVLNSPPPGQNVLSDGLRDQPWDIIVIHEGNKDSVMHDVTYKNNYANMKKHLEYVNANSLADAKILMNFGWANPTSPELLAQGDLVYSKWTSDYQKYSNLDYTTMLENINENLQKNIFENDAISGEFDGKIPTGSAICYARNVLGLGEKTDGLHLYRDNTHMSDLGRLIAGYVWYATITGQTHIDEVNVDVIPRSCCEEIKEDFVVTEQMKQIVKESVNYALANPTTVPTK